MRIVGTPPSGPRSDEAIWACGLVKSFGKNCAVDGVDLHVRAGGVYGVLGPNGAGKTTTIRILTTLLQPDRGEARIFGYDVRSQAHVVRQLISVTGQYASLDEGLSATENLVIFSRLLGLGRRAAKRKAAALLEEFSLTEAAKRPLRSFSGGMRRRLDLAASLIAQPPLIFLDEPTTGLDPHTRAHMWDTIQALATRGSTVLLTTQTLDEADYLADRIAVIDRGRVVAEGTPDELKKSAGASTFLQLHLVDPERTEIALRVVHAVLGTHGVSSADQSWITAPTTDVDQVTDLLIALRQTGIHLTEVNVQRPSLDEAFLALTHHSARDTHARDIDPYSAEAISS